MQETDPSSTFATAAVATIAGHVDVSRQLVDRSSPAIDLALAAELGNAHGEKRDQQILNGTGTAGQLPGLLGAAGQSVAYADATPTVPELLPKIGDLYSRLATTFPPDAILVHPRRRAWLLSAVDSAGSQINPQLPAEVFEVPTIPTTLNTNEDTILMLKRSETILLQGPVRFIAMPEVLSSNLEVRFQSIQYVALLIRQPGSIGKITGSGLATPTFA